MHTNDLKIIRKPLVLQKLGISKSSLQNWIVEKRFPPPVPLGARAVGFFEHEVELIIRAIMAGSSLDTIKQIVRQILIDRKSES